MIEEKAMDALMETLPIEIVRSIRDYVYCSNWRTCKKREASIITSFAKTVREASWVEGSEEFTLFGQMFLIYLPRENHIARFRPMVPPDFKFYREDYLGWYIHHVQWTVG